MLRFLLNGAALASFLVQIAFFFLLFLGDNSPAMIFSFNMWNKPGENLEFYVSTFVVSCYSLSELKQCRI